MPAGTPQPPQRMLIVKPSSLGDVVTAVPVLRGLRRTFPNGRIDWLISTACAPLLEGDEDLDELILFDRRRLGRAWRAPSAARELGRFLDTLRRSRYDWTLDLQGLLRSGIFTAATGAPLRAGFSDAREGAYAFYNRRITVDAAHTVDRNIALARALGVDARPSDMTLQVDPTARRSARELLAGHGLGGESYVVCVPPTRGEAKQYPATRWRRVVAGLCERAPVVLLGSPDTAERELCRRIADRQPGRVVDLCGRTSLREMVAAIADSLGVVCCDSAAKFIAPAVGVSAVTLIGPTRPERTGPYLRGRTVVADVPCRGCLRRRCRHATCMEMIDPDEVIAAAGEMIERGQPCR